MNAKQSILLGVIVGLFLALAFAFGFISNDLLETASASANEPAAVTNYGLLAETQNLIDQVYLREQPSPDVREYAAIRGILSTLEDPNTYFIEPPVAQSEADVLAGTYGGIGVQVQLSEDGRLLLFPFADSPAITVGIEDGDELIAINGADITFSLGPDAIDQMLRGEVKEGSGVEITVQHANSDMPETFFIEFAVINVPSVTWRVLTENEEIGYVQILRFTNRTPDELEDALTGLLDSDISALILDLRNNTGGLLPESVAVANQFIDGGTITYEMRKNSERALDADPGGLATDIPLVILVNHSTASAAELVAGALLDYERGILIGQKTYGKGTVQQIFLLSDGSSVHITAAEWLTPNKNRIDGVGITPTIEMIPDENGRDVELGEGIRYLSEALAESVD